MSSTTMDWCSYVILGNARCLRKRATEVATKRNLPLVSRVLEYGDVLQWAALLADRKLTLRHVPPEAGDPAWLTGVFTLTRNADGLQLKP